MSLMDVYCVFNRARGVGTLMNIPVLTDGTLTLPLIPSLTLLNHSSFTVSFYYVVTELISPKDLHTACQLFPELNLPLRLRKFDSGLLVIQTMARYSDDEVSVTITKRIQDLPPGAGLTAVELAGAIQISVALAQEQLLVCAYLLVVLLLPWLSSLGSKSEED